MDGLLGGAGVAAKNFDGEEQEQPNVSEEEQAEYDLFVKNGMEAMYSEEGEPRPEVVKRLSVGNPGTALAQTTVWLVMMTEKSAEVNGKEISDEVLMHGGQELLEQLADLSEAAGIHEFSQKEMDGAWYSALDLYREANEGEGGRFNNDEAASEFMALNEADKEGRADEVLPGFSRIAARMGSEVAQEQASDVDKDAE